MHFLLCSGLAGARERGKSRKEAMGGYYTHSWDCPRLQQFTRPLALSAGSRHQNNCSYNTHLTCQSPFPPSHMTCAVMFPPHRRLLWSNRIRIKGHEEHTFNRVPYYGRKGSNGLATVATLPQPQTLLCYI